MLHNEYFYRLYTDKEALRAVASRGERMAYIAWKHSYQSNYAKFVLEDFLWDEDIPDFLNALKRAHVREFVYANDSTAALDNMHAIAMSPDWKIGDAVLVYTEEVSPLNPEVGGCLIGFSFIYTGEED